MNTNMKPLETIQNNLSHLSIGDLEEIQDVVDGFIRDKKIEAKKKIVRTKEQIVKEFNDFGFEVPKGSKLYKINGPSDKEGFCAYGLQVGQYTHSCHIDTTEFIVLLVVDGIKTFVSEYSDFWLDEPIIV